ncbi:MAG: lectin-like domain-containing protein, partial [Verrucomicrobiales bacterium]
MMKLLRSLVVTVALAWPWAAWAGRYPGAGVQAFTSAGPITNLGDGTVMASSNNGSDGNPAAVVLANALRLTQSGTGNTLSSFKLPDLDSGRSVQSWDVSLKVRMTAAGPPADGWSLNLGPIPAGTGTGEGGFVMSQGLTIAFDTYDNGSDAPSIEVFANGISVGNFPQPFSFDTTFRPLVIHWDSAGLDLTYTVSGTPVVVCTNLPTPGYVPAAGHTCAFSARTGGATQDTMIDDLLVSTVPLSSLETGGPVISEFGADNQEIL